MRTKSIISSIVLFIYFMSSPDIMSQETELNIDTWNGERENIDIFQETAKFSQTPDAFFMEPSISDFRVNEQAGNSQKYNIRSAINENGISLIVWVDFREGTQNIYAQLLNPDQQPIGENIKVNSTEDIHYYSYPDVAVNSDNQFLVVWTDRRTSYAIYGQFIDEDGSMIGENYEIDDEENTSYKYGTCIDSNGEEFIVAWIDSRGGSNYDIYAQRLNKVGTKVGENFIVNSDSQAVKKNIPDVTINTDGSFFATWYSTTSGSNNIFAVLLDNQNNLVGSQIQVNDSTQDVANHYNSVTAHCNSGFVVTWYRYMNNKYNILAQFIDSSSAKIDTNFIVNDDLTASKLYPSVASDSTGNFFITWYDYRNGYAQIYAQEYIDDVPVNENFKISEDELKGSKSYVSCSINNNKELITTWMDLSETNEYRINSRILDSFNFPVSSSTRVDDDNYSSNEEKPSIEVFEDGSSVVTWTDRRTRNNQVFFQRYDSDGNPLGNNIHAQNSSGSKYDAKVSKLSNQNFVVMWREYYRGINNQNEIVAQKYFKTCEALGEKIIVSSNDLVGNARELDGSSNSNGEFAVSFRKQINGFDRIYAQKFDSDGVPVSDNILVSKDTTTSFYKPKIALDSLGNFAVTYYGYNENNNYDIFLHRYNTVGVEIDSALIVNDEIPISSQYNPDISINNNGECIIIWFDYRAPIGVYFQKYLNIGSKDLFEKVDSNIAVADYSISYCSPTVSLGKDGEFVISWPEQNTNYNDLKFRIFNSDQTPLTEILYVTESQERDQINQDIYFSNDQIFNVWQDNREKGVGYDIWTNVFDYQDFITAVDESSVELPNEFVLNQNYPNPFNPTTTIKYSIPNVVKLSPDLSLQPTQLHIYDILGRKVKTLINKQQSPGNYEVTFDASELSSGIYFYTLNTGEFVQTKKMMLLK